MFEGMRVALSGGETILAIASWIVPRHRRNEWLREWLAELFYLVDAGSRGGGGDRRIRAEAMAFCLGSFRDAVCLRVESARMHSGQLVRLQSPVQCLAVLATIMAMGLFLACVLPSVRDSIWRKPILVHFLILSLALLILPSTTTLAVGLHAGEAGRGSGVCGFRFWFFLGLKSGLLAAVVFLGTFDLGPLISRSGLQPHSTLVGYVLAFRWALNDQRRRCPKCLRRLSDPVRIGQPSATLLDWYGTEFVCAEGHGVLHIPELPRSSYCTSRWITLDTSWRGLFR